jgi:hypothetical protein
LATLASPGFSSGALSVGSVFGFGGGADFASLFGSVMETLSQQPTQNSNVPTGDESVDFIYDYAADRVSQLLAGIGRLDNRLTALLALSGGLLRLAVDLPHDCPIALSLMILVAGSSVLALGIAAYGIRYNPNIAVTSISGLLEPERYALSEPILKLFVLRRWRQAEDEALAVASAKGRSLNRAIGCITIGGIGYGLAVILMGF